MSLSSLKKELQHFDKSALESIILDLYSKSKENKDYLEYFQNPDEEKLLDKYKTKVSDYIFPKRGYRAKIAKAKAVLREFSKWYPNPEMEAELQLIYILRGIAFGKEVYMTSALDDSLHKMTISFFEFIKKHQLLIQFNDRIENNAYLSKRWENFNSNYEE
jgi:hypothetical protein